MSADLQAITTWLNDLADFNTSHQYGDCDCGGKGDHARRHGELIDRKLAILADVKATKVAP